MTPGDWPVAFFDDDYLKIYRPHFTAERTQEEVDFIESALALSPGAAVLDLACGIGRHAVGMALRGYRVTGVDFNDRYLEIARADAERAQAKVTWKKGDMRALGFERSFRGIYSYFTSFGYFSDEENETVLRQVARALEPGGRFLIDMANREWILTHPHQRTWNQDPAGGLLMEEYSLDLRSSRVTSRQIHIEPKSGSQLVKTYDLRVYTCAELSALMNRYGLVVRDAWGGPDRSGYSTESRRLILLSERTDSSGAGA